MVRKKRSSAVQNPSQSERSIGAVQRQTVYVEQDSDGTWSIWQLSPEYRIDKGYESREIALQHVPSRYRYYIRTPANRRYSHTVEYARLDNRMAVAHLDDENRWQWGKYSPAGVGSTKVLKNKLLK